MKLCKDCKYYKRDLTCTYHNRTTSRTSVVTGRTTYTNHVDERTCVDARWSDGFCRPQGLFFKRATLWTRIARLLSN